MTNETHNLWTLGKHLAHSANTTAGKLDVALYGPKPPSFFDLHPIVAPLAALVFVVLVVIVLFVSASDKNPPKPPSAWWWF